MVLGRRAPKPAVRRGGAAADSSRTARAPSRCRCRSVPHPQRRRCPRAQRAGTPWREATPPGSRESGRRQGERDRSRTCAGAGSRGLDDGECERRCCGEESGDRDPGCRAGIHRDAPPVGAARKLAPADEGPVKSRARADRASSTRATSGTTPTAVAGSRTGSLAQSGSRSRYLLTGRRARWTGSGEAPWCSPSRAASASLTPGRACP